MTRTTKSFHRTARIYKKQARVLVLCEDVKSSLIYLSEAARHFRAHAEVEVANCGRNDPQGIVAEALKRKREFDAIYCVVDRDGHPLFAQALAMAEGQKNVAVIASYPCYEFWLLLHFHRNRKPYAPAGANSACDQLVRELENHIAGYQKGRANGLFDMLLDKLPTARANGVHTLAEASQDGALNPSTQLHELMDVFERLGVIQLA